MWIKTAFAVIPSAVVGAGLGALVLWGVAHFLYAGTAGPDPVAGRTIGHWSITGVVIGALSGCVWQVGRGVVRHGEMTGRGLSDEDDTVTWTFAFVILACIVTGLGAWFVVPMARGLWTVFHQL